MTPSPPSVTPAPPSVSPFDLFHYFTRLATTSNYSLYPSLEYGYDYNDSNSYNYNYNYNYNYPSSVSPTYYWTRSPFVSSSSSSSGNVSAYDQEDYFEGIPNEEEHNFIFAIEGEQKYGINNFNFWMICDNVMFFLWLLCFICNI